MISVLEIYTVGIGPSSSHTVGPMKASKSFIDKIAEQGKLSNINKIKCDFYGSLALTGKGHGTDKAFLLGIQGYDPVSIDSNSIPTIIDNVHLHNLLTLKSGTHEHQVSFNPKKDIKFHRRINLPYHPNGMAFAAFDIDNKEIYRHIYYSVGGGFVVAEEEVNKEDFHNSHIDEVRFNFSNARELLEICVSNNCNISTIVLENEKTWLPAEEVRLFMEKTWKIMQECVERGFHNHGILPGGLGVQRRAPKIYEQLIRTPERNLIDTLNVLDWVNLYALSVNEENAAGGKVVTAPTNGAAGIVPAVLHYFTRFCPQATDEKVTNFLLTAGAIGILYKENASISGAEVGCQGEVGVACSMAAAGLCEVLGGTPAQVENAAEIAMEHNLGLTCDPIGGLVQIPCIERNAMGAIKAINAARMALRGDGSHFVSLDKVIETMKQTGKDMKKQYKETSRGGLAVNIPEC